MVFLFQLTAIFINLVLLQLTIIKLKRGLRLIHFVSLLFQVVFVLPIILEWIFGIQDYSYKSPGFDEALNDTYTNIYYSLFVIVIPLGFTFIGRKRKYKNIDVPDIKDSLSSLRIKRELYTVFLFLMFLPLVLALLSPSPDKYLTEYAFFQKYPHLATENELWYHKKILKFGGIISLLSILVIKLFSKNSFINNIIIYLAAIITGILNGKRTLFAFIILGITAVDILKSPKGKFPYRRALVAASFIVIMFISYAFLIDKHTGNVSTLDNLRLYFFRDVDVKFSIYALLNSEEYKIFEYWGQSYLYNILFFIPRFIWMSKPYPYDIYVTASSLGFQPGTVLTWSFQTSFFGEAISNLGWFGIPFSLILLNKFISYSERTKSPFVVLLAMFIITFSFMNHFGAYSIYFVVWLISVIYSRLKRKKQLMN